MADTTTTNFGLVKPEVGASSDTWGTKLNSDLDAIDTLLGNGSPIKIDTTNDRLGVNTATPATAFEVNGQASFSDGSAAAPSITNTGDLNTGIFFPAADTIAFAEGGVERMRLDASGNVGIGTDAPTLISTGITTLDLKGNDASQTDRSGGVQFTRYDDTVGMQIYHGDGANSIVGLSTYPMLFFTNGAERVRIVSAGSVGIGTTTPNQLLDVNGTARVTSLGVGVNSSGTTGEIRASNNITAYFSDDRLKTRFGNIDDALGKLMSLSGFYYEPNGVAQALGYEVKKEVGVSAQEVQAVMPEVVAPAPIDEQYLTVRYERLVPLLIEAIKEQQTQINKLRRKLEGVE
jgi:hypothetical protein